MWETMPAPDVVQEEELRAETPKARLQAPDELPGSRSSSSRVKHSPLSTGPRDAAGPAGVTAAGSKACHGAPGWNVAAAG